MVAISKPIFVKVSKCKNICFHMVFEAVLDWVGGEGEGGKILLVEK